MLILYLCCDTLQKVLSNHLPGGVTVSSYPIGFLPDGRGPANPGRSGKVSRSLPARAVFWLKWDASAATCCTRLVARFLWCTEVNRNSSSSSNTSSNSHTAACRCFSTQWQLDPFLITNKWLQIQWVSPLNHKHLKLNENISGWKL